MRIVVVSKVSGAKLVLFMLEKRGFEYAVCKRRYLKKVYLKITQNVFKM